MRWGCIWRGHIWKELTHILGVDSLICRPYFIAVGFLVIHLCRLSTILGVSYGTIECDAVDTSHSALLLANRRRVNVIWCLKHWLGIRCVQMLGIVMIIVLQNIVPTSSIVGLGCAWRQHFSRKVVDTGHYNLLKAAGIICWQTICIGRHFLQGTHRFYCYLLLHRFVPILLGPPDSTRCSETKSIPVLWSCLLLSWAAI